MFSQIKAGEDEYQKMVEQMQFLELMFDSQQQETLSRPPPVRANSEPVIQALLDFDHANGTFLKSFPAYKQESTTEKDFTELEALITNREIRSDFVKDGAVRPGQEGFVFHRFSYFHFSLPLPF